MRHLYNEHNAYRAAVLRERIEEGLLPEGVVDERDIETIPDEEFLGYAQIHLFAGIGGFPLGLRRAGFSEDLRIVTGGFPCQDISNAGKRAGIAGARSGLWREMVRCVRVVRPELVFVENVAALLGRGMGRVLGDLAETGYDADGDCLSAAEVGAPHLRRRIWIVAYPRSGRFEICPALQTGQPAVESGCETLADATSARSRRLPIFQGRQNKTNTHADGRSQTLGYAEHDGRKARSRQKAVATDGRRPGSSDGRRWPVEPDVGRVAHGIPRRVDRLAALGDAIVPQCVEEIVRRMRK